MNNSFINEYTCVVCDCQGFGGRKARRAEQADGLPPGGHLPVLLFGVLLLPRLRQLASIAQAAGADVDIAHDAIEFEAAAMHIQHEAAARALL